MKKQTKKTLKIKKSVLKHYFLEKKSEKMQFIQFFLVYFLHQHFGEVIFKLIFNVKMLW